MSRLTGLSLKAFPAAGGVAGYATRAYAPVSLDAKGVGLLRSSVTADDGTTRFTVEVSLFGNGVNPLTGRAKSQIRIHAPIYESPVTGEASACCTLPLGKVKGVAHADISIDYPAGVTTLEQTLFVDALQRTLFQNVSGEFGLLTPGNSMFNTAALGERVF